MLTRRMVRHINERPREVNRLPLAAIGAGAIVLAALLGTLASSVVLAAGALVAGAAGVLLAYRGQKSKMLTTITYGDLRGDLKARFSAVQEGCEALSSSEAIWRSSGPLEQRVRKIRGDAVPLPAREPARVGGIEEVPGKVDGRQGRGSEAEEDAEKSEAYYDSLSMKEKARIASAFTTLGVRKGATMAEISAAYKKLARANHPDKVAMLEPEEREVAERRMKEVNAAYTVLKHFRRDLAGGAG